MNKANKNITANSDLNYSLNLANSVVTGVLVFFHLGPLTLGIIEKIITSIDADTITLVKKLKFATYYVANGLVTFYLVKLQRKKTKTKSMAFRKRYSISATAILVSFILIRYLF